MPGELYVAGERLGRGYFNRPELTARIYLPDPFSSTPGARIYKTGDLVRFLPDGSIEYLGRIDHQVKIRGFRVELGEIEEQLRLHSGVKDCTVQALEAGGDRKLAAWFVPREHAAPALSELRAFLRERLPEHMLPASFTVLSELPLTPNGKVDRRALPAPDTARGDESVYQPPSTPTEKTLSRLWSSLLELEQVSIHDNFFHLGGHSLLATQLLTRVNETFRLQLPLRRIFEAPTLAQQAEFIESALRSGSTELRPELRPIAAAATSRAPPPRSGSGSWSSSTPATSPTGSSSPTASPRRSTSPCSSAAWMSSSAVMRLSAPCSSPPPMGHPCSGLLLLGPSPCS